MLLEPLALWFIWSGNSGEQDTKRTPMYKGQEDEITQRNVSVLELTQRGQSRRCHLFQFKFIVFFLISFLGSSWAEHSYNSLASGPKKDVQWVKMPEVPPHANLDSCTLMISFNLFSNLWLMFVVIWWKSASAISREGRDLACHVLHYICSPWHKIRAL